MNSPVSILARSSRLLFLLTSFLFLATGCSSGKTESPQQPIPIQVSTNVTLAGPIDGYADSDLRDTDTLVVDLRMAEEEGAEEEVSRLNAAGIRHLQFPMGREVPTLVQVRRFEAVLSENGERPILIHCSSGNRAGLLWAAHLIEQNVGVDEAVAAVHKIANRKPTQQAIRNYAKGGAP